MSSNCRHLEAGAPPGTDRDQRFRCPHGKMSNQRDDGCGDEGIGGPVIEDAQVLSGRSKDERKLADLS